MYYNLFLDDERNPRDVTWAVLDAYTQVRVSPSSLYAGSPWVVVRTVRDALNEVRLRGIPRAMSLDHDLGEPETGYDFVKQMVALYDNDVLGISTYIHSMNPIGARNILGYIDGFKRVRG